MNDFAKRSVLALVAWCASACVSVADYFPTQFFELVGGADLVATGEIVEVRKETFVLKIEQLLIGMHRDKVEIGRFHDWVCAWRWAPYAVGQKVLVFAKEYDGKLELPGTGGEAESPIVGEHVLCQFPCGLKPFEEYGKHSASKVPFKDLRDAIIEYRSCFRMTPAKEPGRRTGRFSQIKQICSDSALATYQRKSEIHKLLVDTTRREQERIREVAKKQ